jgi:hypothetical protein
VTCIAWSVNGAYVLTAALDRQLLLWDLHTRETLDQYKSDMALVGASWLGNEAALMTRDGELAVWRDIVPQTLPSPVKADAKAAVFDNDAAKIAQLLAESAVKTHRARDSDDDDDDAHGNADADEAIADADAADAEIEAKLASTTPVQRIAGASRLRKKAGVDTNDTDVATAAASVPAASVPRQASFMSNASPASRRRRILCKCVCVQCTCAMSM